MNTDLLYYKKIASGHMNTACTHMHCRNGVCESQSLNHNDKKITEKTNLKEREDLIGPWLQ